MTVNLNDSWRDFQALHQFEMEDAEDAQHEQSQQSGAEDPQAAGKQAKRRARRQARPGRIRGLVQVNPLVALRDPVV